MLSSVVAVAIIFTQSCYGYSIPVPEIIAYKPQGFSVSIPDAHGIRLFAFHGSINKNLKNFYPGDLSKEVSEPINGKWTFHDTRTKLNVGDRIHYWLYVLKGSLGYRYQDRSFTVTELIPSTAIYDEAPVKDIQVCSNELNTLCLQSLFNITQSFSQLQSYTENLQKKNVQLREYIEHSPSARKLTLSGKIPPDGQPTATVTFVLRERLNMNPIIVGAQRHFDGTITFEVGTIDDKLDILDAAKLKLTSTKIFIT